MTAELRVTWLMRSYYDARECWDGRADGSGVLLMPSDFRRGSYAELERQLAEMRDNGHRREWWHTTRRYRDGMRLSLDVPVRRTQKGAIPILPRNCELVGGAVFSGARRARVLVRRWPDKVNLDLADAGVRLLVETMYDGRRDRIVLPPAVFAVAYGGA